MSTDKLATKKHKSRKGLLCGGGVGEEFGGDFFERASSFKLHFGILISKSSTETWNRRFGIFPHYSESVGSGAAESWILVRKECLEEWQSVGTNACQGVHCIGYCIGIGSSCAADDLTESGHCPCCLLTESPKTRRDSDRFVPLFPYDEVRCWFAGESNISLANVRAPGRWLVLHPLEEKGNGICSDVSNGFLENTLVVMVGGRAELLCPEAQGLAVVARFAGGPNGIGEPNGEGHGTQGKQDFPADLHGEEDGTRRGFGKVEMHGQPLKRW